MQAGSSHRFLRGESFDSCIIPQNWFARITLFVFWFYKITFEFVFHTSLRSGLPRRAVTSHTGLFECIEPSLSRCFHLQNTHHAGNLAFAIHQSMMLQKVKGVFTIIFLAGSFARKIQPSKVRSEIVRVLFDKGSRPIRIRPPIQGVGEPPIELEVKERRYRRIRIHRTKDPQDFFLYPFIREGFNSFRIISLRGVLGRMNAKFLALTVTVTNKMPDPGRKFSWSRLCQIGYLPRSGSA